MYFWKQTICSSQLDVQETDVIFSQLHRVRNYLSGAGLRMDGLPALHLWDIVIEVLRTQAPGNLSRHNPTMLYKFRET